LQVCLDSGGARSDLKTCSKCREQKHVSAFSADRYRADGLCVRCKACRKTNYEATKPQVAETSRRYYVANKETHDARSTAYYYANRDRQAKRMAKWYIDNKELVMQNVAAYLAARPGFSAAVRAKRRAQEIRATPPWADLDAIKEIYAEAARISRETGIPHHVDHRIPLQGRLVCGLHVEGNLQILPAKNNLSKGNKFLPTLMHRAAVVPGLT
jgi:hypothetical protein